MFRIFRKVTALVAMVTLMGAAVGAHAANIGQTDSYSFGVLSSSQGVSVGNPVFGFSGSFDNIFSFVAGAYPGVTGAVTGFDVVGDMTARYRLGYGPDLGSLSWSSWSALLPVPQDPSTGFFAFSQTFTGLTPGTTYAFNLAGSAVQAGYSVTLAPVPEPESWALMLAGLGLLVAVARRRRLALVA